MLKKLIIPVLAFIMISAGKDTTMTFNGKELENSLAYIPMSTTNFPIQEFGPPVHKKFYVKDSSKTEVISENAFYISKYEVCNKQYLFYIYDLLANGKKEAFLAALPDTLIWREEFNEAYTEYYFRHPAYRDYPVVGVTYEQSKKYCEWLTQKYSKEIKKKFPNAVFKLPTVKQWYVAACGGLTICDYPWGGPYVRNKKGEYLANFSVIQDRCIYRDEKTDELKVDKDLSFNTGSGNYISEDITAPVFSYYPNDYGLHNMAGNVSEFVMEKGITKGGSWKDPAYYLQNYVAEKYDTLNSAAADRGFRFVMELSK